MIKRLVLTDFLAHGRTEIVFGPGLTALVGPNNSGKSAVVEALRCLATNPTPRHFIRHGAKLARVEAELDDGHRVAWIRKPTYAMYELWRPGAAEPEVFAKFGRKPPEEILNVLRLNLVEIEGRGEPVDVHLGNQRDPIFLLREPGSTVASFFAASTESAHLLEMQRLLQHRAQARKSKLKQLEARQVQVLADLDRLGELPALALRLEAARERLQAAQREAANLPGLERVIQDARGLERSAEHRRASAETLADLTPPPALWPAAPLAILLDSLEKAQKRVRAASARREALAPLADPPALQDCAALARNAARQRELLEARRRAERSLDALGELIPPPEPTPTAGLADVLNRLREVLKVGKLTRARSDAMSALREPPALAETKPLAETLAALRQASARERALVEELASRQAEIERFEAAMAERLRQIGRCPLCNAELELARVTGLAR